MKIFLSLVIALLPFSAVRCFFYTAFFGYKFKNSKLGWLVVIDANSFSMSNSMIGRMNFFRGPMKVEIADGVQIGFRNRFNCGKWVAKNPDYKRSLKIKEDVLITNGHHFDVAGDISIGERSVIAGMGTQFWTHGNGVTNRDIFIGNDCYIGTSCIFCPGTQISDKTLVGAGTVISKTFDQENVLIVGSEGKIKRSLEELGG